ncbi:MAG: DUF3127 domain-containing protein [archaeon]|nr:DUF3127 domain-containing protein [archaeon]
MAFKQQGSVISKSAMESGVVETIGKKWSRQRFVIQTFGDYPKKICIQGFGEEKCEMINKLKQNQLVEVYFGIESVEYNDRWYTNCNLFKLISLNIPPPY